MKSNNENTKEFILKISFDILAKYMMTCLLINPFILELDTNQGCILTCHSQWYSVMRCFLIMQV